MINLESRQDLFGIRRFTSIRDVTRGTVIQFFYKDSQRIVLVLDPYYQGKLHGIKLDDLTVHQIYDVIKMFESYYDEEAEENVYAESSEERGEYIQAYKMYKQSRFAQEDAYRKYHVNEMKLIRRVNIKEPEVVVEESMIEEPTVEVEVDEFLEQKSYGMYGDEL